MWWEIEINWKKIMSIISKETLNSYYIFEENWEKVFEKEYWILIYVNNPYE